MEPLSSASAKKARRGKKCVAFGCVLIHSTIVRTQLLHHIFKSNSLPSEVDCRCNLIKRQSNNDGLHVSMNTVLCHHHFTETSIKKSFLRWNFLVPGFAPSQNLPDKTITATQERKLSVKRKIIVKSRHK